ncbi:MAG TPA: DUF5947 family protein [Terriglobia bacterium]|jgi:hypothetical protein
MSAPTPAFAEACDFCHAHLAELHQHLLDQAGRKLVCVCDACAILFSDPSQKYRRVPRRIKCLPEFRMSDGQWDALMIPIGIAFVFQNSTVNRVMALYPSPAGPVESLLTLASWDEIVRDNPELRTLQSDVEGLLVYRVGTAREQFIVPIDECFKLIGLIRIHWKGFSGGMEMWREIGKFLEHLKERSTK